MGGGPVLGIGRDGAGGGKDNGVGGEAGRFPGVLCQLVQFIAQR